MTRVYPAIALPPGVGDGGRADVEVSGLEQAGASFELRVFLGDPDADADTPLTPTAGYAGSIHIYGYGEPATDTPGPRMPMTRTVIATEAVRAAAATARTTAVTLVAVPYGSAELDPGVDLDHVGVAVLA